MRPRLKLMIWTILTVFVLPIAVRAGFYMAGDGPRDWRTANYASTGLLPPAAQDREPRVLVFAARNFSWRGIFASHTWIVVKAADAATYTRYDVSGFSSNPIRVNAYPPDGLWFSAKPRVIADLRGPAAAQAIPKIQSAVADYAYAGPGSYRLWPGPNSNTFIATLLRAAPELDAAMPPEAVGRDYRVDGWLAGLTASRTGVEVSLYGALGAKLGWVEGVEVNFLGLVAGLDIRHPAVKIPGFGRIGVDPVQTATAQPR
jgi:hypothetical protein